MNHFRVFLRLAAIMTGVCIIAVTVTTYFLYLDSIRLYKERLVSTCRIVKSSVEELVLINTSHLKKHPNTGHENYVLLSTIDQIRWIVGQYGDSEDIEITIAYLDGSNIKWISKSHEDESLYVPIPMEHAWAIPMQLALKKGRSVIKAKDYRGEEVLAAYDYTSGLGIGIVTKTPIYKIKLRFFKGALIGLGQAFGVMIIGIALFIRITSPVISKLELDKALYKKTSEEKEKLRKEYESLVVNVPGMIYVGFEDWTTKIISGSEVVTGYTEEEINEKKENWLSVVHPKDKERVYAGSLRKGGGQKAVVQEYQIVSKDGSIRWVEDHKVLVKNGGPVDRVIGILFDITDRVLADEELKKLNDHQRRVSKTEAIGNFANGIAHDFNNALSPIIGNCDLIIHDMQGEDKCSRHERQIANILHAAETASLLVHRLQTFTASDTSVDDLTPLKLEGCLREAFDFLRSMIPSSIDMTMYVDPTIYTIAATEVTIRQILMNLCKNASQAMENDKGKIKIEVRNDRIEVERYGLIKGNYVKIEVEDDGLGMSPETVERALDPYFTTKKEGEGTGIGLSVVNGIVTSYGGIVRIYSEIGRGTRVVIYIPAVEEEGVKARECVVDTPIPIGNKENILLVDDEIMIVESSTMILESLNYWVTPFNSSIKALDEFNANPDKYDVLITDLTMPEMTGVNLIQRVKEKRPDIKIILCSGLGTNGKQAKGMLKESIDVFITKPVTRRGYGEALDEVLKSEKKERT